MKHSVISIVALAGITAFATPLTSRREVKHFKPPSWAFHSLEAKCGWSAPNTTELHSEECLGTRMWCEGGYFNEGEKEIFATTEECLASRIKIYITEPKPFKEQVVGTERETSAICGTPKSSPRYYTEDCQGTVLYCVKGHFDTFGEWYRNPADCLRLRGRATEQASGNNTTESHENAGAGDAAAADTIHAADTADYNTAPGFMRALQIEAAGKHMGRPG